MKQKTRENFEKVVAKGKEIFGEEPSGELRAFIEGAKNYAVLSETLDDKDNLKRLGVWWRMQLRRYELARFKMWGMIHMASMTANKNQIIVNTKMAKQSIPDILNRKGA